MHLCTHPYNKSLEIVVEEDSDGSVLYICLVLGACVDAGSSRKTKKKRRQLAQKKKGQARAGELAAAVCTAAPAAATAGAAGAEAGRDLCSSGIHGGELPCLSLSLSLSLSLGLGG